MFDNPNRHFNQSFYRPRRYYYTPFFDTSANPPHADYPPTSDPGELHCIQKEDIHLSDSKYHAMQARFKPVTPSLFYLFRALPLYRNGASA